MAKAKKTKKSSLKDIFTGIASDLLIGVVKQQIVSTTKEILDSIKESVYKVGKTLAQFFLSGVVITVGLIYLLISFVLITKDYFHITLGFSFLAWAVILLFVGVVYSAHISKNK
jgi:hypothetical protein